MSRGAGGKDRNQPAAARNWDAPFSRFPPQALFGRTAEKNGNAGIDHGHGSLMMVLGGPVQDGKIYGKWHGLEKEQLYEGRDVAVTTDFRAVLSELVRGHLGQNDLSAVFSGFEPGTPLGLLPA